MIEKKHIVLTKAATLKEAGENVLRFFDKTLLLHYDSMRVRDEISYSANDPKFWPALQEALAANRQVLDGFLTELAATGCRQVEDFHNIETGYPSKVFHIIAHLLDGFVGIDSVFYNLLESSHGITSSLEQTIRERGAQYWLIYLEASFSSSAEASLIHGEDMP